MYWILKTETGGETVSKLTGSSFKIDLHKSSLFDIVRLIVIDQQ